MPKKTKVKKKKNNNKKGLQRKLSSLGDASESGERKVLKKLFAGLEKKWERRATLVTGKMPKMGNSYNLLREACYMDTV